MFPLAAVIRFLPVFSRAFHLSHYLVTVLGTEPFDEFCRTRGIPFRATHTAADADRWAAALASLGPDERLRVELELAEAAELSAVDGTAHLVAAAGNYLPPADVPAGMAVALWFYLHRPDVFREVLSHHDIREDYCWRRAKSVAEIQVTDLPAKAAALKEELRSAFGRDAGIGRFCAMDTERCTDALWFLARVIDRIRCVEHFTDGGEEELRYIRPAFNVFFVYTPHDGVIWLKSPVRASNRIRDLFQCFGTAVLAAPVAFGGTVFDLDRLKRPFHPLPDADDMELVRVKSLHLCYPQRRGRRRVTFETLPCDVRDAMQEMLRDHGGGEASELRVSHAELQVRMRVGGRIIDHLIRLWPDRYSLSRTPLGQRLFECLRRWGLCRG